MTSLPQYAPKDKQTEALCKTPPESICDQEYGLSIGRGSFKFAAGAWTHVNQTVRLNTPGKQDGGFTLLVNGQEVISRSDVFYRDVVKADAPKPTDATPPKAPPASVPAPPPADPLGGLLGGLGGILGGLIGSILHTPWDQSDSVPVTVDNSTGVEGIITLSPSGNSAAESVLDFILFATTVTTTTTGTTIVPPVTLTTTLQWMTTTTTTVYPGTQPTGIGSLNALSFEGASQPKPVGFIGLFFRYGSTT